MFEYLAAGLLTGLGVYYMAQRKKKAAAKKPKATIASDVAVVKKSAGKPENVREAKDFTPKPMAQNILDLIQASFPNDNIEFTFYPMSNGDKKITAKFPNGDAFVSVGPSTHETAKMLAERLKVEL